MSYSYTDHWVRTHLQNIQGGIEEELETQSLVIPQKPVSFILIADSILTKWVKIAHKEFNIEREWIKFVEDPSRAIKNGEEIAWVKSKGKVNSGSKSYHGA